MGPEIPVRASRQFDSTVTCMMNYCDVPVPEKLISVAINKGGVCFSLRKKYFGTPGEDQTGVFKLL